jgi:integration host factor subunit alpha
LPFDSNSLALLDQLIKENGGPMTKAELIEAVYSKVGISKKESADLVEMIFDTMKDTLSNGEKIKISGFGNFVVREKRSRMGRNPQTGESMEISARRVLTFRPSQVLKNDLNGGEGPVGDDDEDDDDAE